MTPVSDVDRPVPVVAAVIRRGDGAVLISERPANVHQGGLWEFPGGKTECSERPIDALARELNEELGIAIDHALPLIAISHRYADKHVEIRVFEVLAWSGEPSGREGQKIRWVTPEALSNYAFPAANVAVKSALKLPPVLCVLPVTGARSEPCMDNLKACLQGGIRLVQVQPAAGPGALTRELTSAAAGLCDEFGAKLIVGGTTGEVLCGAAHGRHVTAGEMRSISERPISRNHLLSVACHSPLEIEHAARIGADFITIGPVHEEHPASSTSALGWHGLSRLVKQAGIPVFALGHMKPEDIRLARRAGCHGIGLKDGEWDWRETAAIVRSSNAALAQSAYRIGSGRNE